MELCPTPLIHHHGVDRDNFVFTYLRHTCVISAAGKASNEYGNPRDFLTKQKCFGFAPTLSKQVTLTILSQENKSNLLFASASEYT